MILRKIQPLRKICARKQLSVHQAVEVNRAGALRRPVKGAGVVVHADGEIVQPHIQPRFMQAKAVVPAKVKPDAVEFVAQPFCVSVPPARDASSSAFRR